MKEYAIGLMRPWKQPGTRLAKISHDFWILFEKSRRWTDLGQSDDQDGTPQTEYSHQHHGCVLQMEELLQEEDAHYHPDDL